jgi:murein L,D-transpeptidase YafK
MKQLLIFISLSLTFTSNSQESLQTIVKEHRILSSELLIKIDKSAYELAVWHADSVLITYPCVFGFEPIRDKYQEGDGCTPEGTFGIRSMYPHSGWKYFIWIDYPNEESWSRFKRRKREGKIDQNATIGGEIGIHGVPEGSDNWIYDRMNWTLGCISLKNADITDLYKSISKDTKVLIVE